MSWLTGLVILGLIATQGWLFYRVYNLEKALSIAQSNIVTLDGRVNIHDSSLVLIRSSISTLETGLNYVTPLAENANMYAHSHYSDQRLKTNVSDLSGALAGVMALHSVRYDWNIRDFPQMSFDGHPQIGLLAQEVEQVYPELVSTDANGYKMVDYARLTPILIQAIQEQQALITALQTQIATGQ